MFRVLTILAAIAALAVSAAPVARAGGREVEVLGRDAVTVEEDGNGVRSDRFATAVGGSDVRFVLVVENGSAPVSGLAVTLNDDAVFDGSGAFTRVRRRVALNPVGAEDNALVIAARGAPGSAARVRILAVRRPVEQGREVEVLGRDAVTVEEDGNGVRSDRFATAVGGSDVRFVLVVENGSAPVSGLAVTLNDDVVFDGSGAFTRVRRRVALNPVGAEDNALVIAARGAPGSAARVRILAVRRAPLDQA